MKGSTNLLENEEVEEEEKKFVKRVLSLGGERAMRNSAVLREHLTSKKLDTMLCFLSINL